MRASSLRTVKGLVTLLIVSLAARELTQYGLLSVLLITGVQSAEPDLISAQNVTETEVLKTA